MPPVQLEHHRLSKKKKSHCQTQLYRIQLPYPASQPKLSDRNTVPYARAVTVCAVGAPRNVTGKAVIMTPGARSPSRMVAPPGSYVVGYGPDGSHAHAQIEMKGAWIFDVLMSTA
jgi:hypothetical protein